MRRVLCLVFLVVVVWTGYIGAAPLRIPYQALSGLHLVAADGTYLGRCTINQYAVDSFLNPYGLYGSKYSITSIWNEYGLYGSKYSIYSAFNDYATDPPAIVLDGKVIGYLTTNEYLLDGINPWIFINFLKEKGI